MKRLLQSKVWTEVPSELPVTCPQEEALANRASTATRQLSGVPVGLCSGIWGCEQVSQYAVCGRGITGYCLSLPKGFLEGPFRARQYSGNYLDTEHIEIYPLRLHVPSHAERRSAQSHEVQHLDFLVFSDGEPGSPGTIK